MDSITVALKVKQAEEHKEKQDMNLMRPYYHFLSALEGNHDRRLLIQWKKVYNAWLNVPEEKFVLIDKIGTLLHDFNVLVDDYIDDSVSRNGVPVAHSIYGVPFTITCSMQVLFLCYEYLIKLNHPDAVRIFTEQQMQCSFGWATETYWKANNVCPSIEQYILMTFQKGGDFLLTGIYLAQLFSKNKADFSKLIYLICIYFQLANDRNNLVSKVYQEERSLGEDITEGKMSYPIVLAVHREKPDDKIFNILKMHTHDNAMKAYCIDLIEKLGSFDMTMQNFEVIDRLICEEAAKHGPNAAFDEFMIDLRNYGKYKE